MEQTQNPVITIEGKNYNFQDLTPDVQNMVTLYNSWSTDLVKQRTEIIKLELAIRSVTQDIMNSMKNVTSEEPEKTDVIDVPTIDENTEYEGIVKWYNDAKGFGFITPAEKYHKDIGKDDVYVHWSEIKAESAFKTLREDQHVKFRIRDGNGGRQAAHVITI